MTRDDRFYAFIVARTSRSRAHIRRISLHKRWLKASAVGLSILFCGLIYGFYGLTQQAEHLRVERENQKLRDENAKQRQQLQKLQNLNNRVDAVEDASRKLAAQSGVQDQTPPASGQGGPARPVDSAAALAALEAKTAKVEHQLRIYEDFLRSSGRTPSIWPVFGRLESGVGGRRNPFGGRGYEYHEGQDIDAQFGTPVEAAAAGKVIIAGWQRGYGNVVYLDHGRGLTTRYGHLSKIDVSIGQAVSQGQEIGLVGSTGRSTGPHLHYEVRINNQPVDPKKYLPGAEGR